MSLKSRRELLSAVSIRYRGLGRLAKGRLLDEFVETTGYVRKYAISLLVSAPRLFGLGTSAASAAPRTRRRTYGPEISHPLLFLWRMSGCLCSRRLVPFLPKLLDALERHGELTVCPQVREKLLVMSTSTAERLLRSSRRALGKGLSTTRSGPLLRNQIPIHTYHQWSLSEPGIMEVDLVAHCGGTSDGEFTYTLTMTDICTGWTDYEAIPNRSQKAVEAGMELIRRRLPFRLLGIDTDNGAEFINHQLVRYCDEHKINFTRCRAYRKNDQAHIEQKNGAVIRPLVGYARYEGAEATAYINCLYAVHRLTLNYFEPSMKLVGKNRVGSKVTKVYDEAKTPLDRLLASGHLTEKTQKTLEARFLKLNPAKQRRDIEELTMGLRRFTVDRMPPAPSSGVAVGGAMAGGKPNVPNA